VLWFVGLVLVRRAGKSLPWHENGAAPDSSAHASGHRTRSSSSADSKHPKPSTARTALIFAVAAIATLVSGYALEQSGDAASSQIGISGVLFGATFLALATSLPEVSTGLQAIRQGDDNLAISDIFGGNTFLPVLFLVAGLISGKAILPVAKSSDVYLTALAMVLTLIYVMGLLFRPKKRVLGMGIDSLLVVIAYLLGVAGLVGISG
jgi:cation:H+ antiporter